MIYLMLFIIELSGADHRCEQVCVCVNECLMLMGRSCSDIF